MRLIALSLLLVACQPAIVMPQVPEAGHPDPVAAADSTFQVEVSLDGELNSTGTGWILGVDQTGTAVMTAGHVCSDPEASYVLVYRGGYRVPAELQRTADEPDLCLLFAEGNLGEPLLLAPTMPEYGTEVAYAGAPVGIWGKQIAPFYFGHYIGQNVVTAPTAPGASGSAVIGPEGVIGVLVAVARGFNHLTFIVPVDDIRAFLAY